MPTGIVIENNFSKGLITEATGFNFPLNAVTETYDCEFDLDGSVYRRLGFDFEADYETKTIQREDVAITTYLWKNVAGNGDVSVEVMQVGDTLFFYEANTVGSFSLGAVADTVTLTPVAGAPIADTVEAQFSDGNGYLFVTHPYCEPMRISYDEVANTATETSITIEIRDFEGVPDGIAVDNRPTTTFAAMDEDHEYNLKNQGWTVPNLTAWDTAQTTMPSNADVMWLFKNATNDFDFTTASIDRITTGNTPAPNGHFILELADQDRDAAASTSGVPSTTTGFQRPSTSAFFAGRLFYAGINTAGFNSNIYFTQIVEKDEQYGRCYQVNDPTSENLFDLLPSDGGVIRIPEAGTIIKLMTVPGGLCAFSANGTWFITGSTGIGFTANDYTVQKIGNIPALTATSFVNVAGMPSWWNAEGIYIMTAQGNLPTIQSLTDNSIKTFYDDIPLVSKRFARGLYFSTERVIKWLYRSEATNQLTETYEFDRVLNFNTLNQAMYPWTVTPSDVKVHAIVDADLNSRSVGIEVVVDELGAPVVDGLGAEVYVFTETGLQDLPASKFVVSYPEAGSYEFTFADVYSDTYMDWFTYDDAGENYNSYFITGYKLAGEGIKKYQNNWVRIYSRLEDPVMYNFQAIWDYALTGNTGRWSSSQQVSHTNLNYSTESRRLKVRGSGLAMQFKVASVEGEPFDIIGWSAMQTSNTGP